MKWIHIIGIQWRKYPSGQNKMWIKSKKEYIRDSIKGWMMGWKCKFINFRERKTLKPNPQLYEYTEKEAETYDNILLARGHCFTASSTEEIKHRTTSRSSIFHSNQNTRKKTNGIS